MTQKMTRSERQELSGTNRLMGDLIGQFDGHAHIFRSDLPMTSPRRYTPDYHAEPEAYCARLKQHNLDGALLVQPSFLGTENSYMLNQMASMARESGLTFKAVIVLDPTERPIDKPFLENLSQRGVIGIRLNLVGMSDGDVNDLSSWERLVRLTDQIGWHVELHCEGPRLRSPLNQLLDWSHTVVVDHFGLPDAFKVLQCDSMKTLSDAPKDRLFVKCSAPYRIFPTSSSSNAAQQIQPVFDHLYQAIGPDHLIWGSDWPHTRFESQQSYQECLNWKTQYLAS
ncbi:MAG: amidohydrolase family protein [Cohaesibacter sp.]|nr:amidohydrolase family protein [Cohaesibacter sp.]MCV6600955.1 amidohydrolase family protein [Cohaesibacter sp.]